MKLIPYEERLARFLATYKRKETRGRKKTKRTRYSSTGKVRKYKNKRGPKKKKGPKVSYYERKKREQAKELKKLNPKSRGCKNLYKIIITSNGKQKKYVKCYNTLAQAIEAFNNIIEENKLVKFPKKFTKVHKVISDANFELILLKKNVDQETPEPTKLRNEIGVLTDHIVIGSNRWSIYDKAPYYYEDDFWVYGFHPINQRKDFNWIFDNLVINKLNGEKYDLFRILLHRNMVLILDDYDNFSMVICKNVSDGIRLYNLIVDNCKELKLKQLIELGDITTNTVLYDNITKLIMDKTGWNEIKVRKGIS